VVGLVNYLDHVLSFLLFATRTTSEELLPNSRQFPKNFVFFRLLRQDCPFQVDQRLSSHRNPDLDLRKVETVSILGLLEGLLIMLSRLDLVGPMNSEFFQQISSLIVAGPGLSELGLEVFEHCKLGHRSGQDNEQATDLVGKAHYFDPLGLLSCESQLPANAGPGPLGGALPSIFARSSMIFRRSGVVRSLYIIEATFSVLDNLSHSVFDDIAGLLLLLLVLEKFF
jgi:hypothetical protein